MSLPKETFILSTTFAVAKERRDDFSALLCGEIRDLLVQEVGDPNDVLIAKVHQDENSDPTFNVQVCFSSLESLTRSNDKFLPEILKKFNSKFSGEYASFQTLIEKLD